MSLWYAWIACAAAFAGRIDEGRLADAASGLSFVPPVPGWSETRRCSVDGVDVAAVYAPAVGAECVVLGIDPECRDLGARARAIASIAGAAPAREPAALGGLAGERLEYLRGSLHVVELAAVGARGLVFARAELPSAAAGAAERSAQLSALLDSVRLDRPADADAEALDPVALADLAVEHARASLRGLRTPELQAEEMRFEARLASRFAQFAAEDLARFGARLEERLWEPALVKLADGALLADDFSGSALDLHRWGIWQQDPGLSVHLEGGELAIRGVPDSLRQIGPAFVGAVSRTFAERDVVLRVRMRCAAPLAGSRGKCRGIVHLCGTVPDFYSDVGYGYRPDEPLGWWVEHRGDWRAQRFRVDATGREADEWHEVRIRSDAAARTLRSDLGCGAGWVTAADALPLALSSSKVELKVESGALDGAVDFRFDDCRLYAEPRSRAVEFQVNRRPGDGEPLGDVRLVLEILGQGDLPAAEGISDASGRAQLALPEEVDCPAQFRLRAYRADRLLWDTESAPALGTFGLYPGDVWVLLLGTRS